MGFTKLIRHADAPQMLQSTGNPADSSAYPNADESALTSARKNRLKILFWDKTGWWVCAKRLEVGTLAWPASPNPSMELSSEELTLLLSGIDLSKTHRRPRLNRASENRPDEASRVGST
jgi:transposase